MQPIFAKAAFVLSLFAALVVIVVGSQMFGSYIREQARDAAIEQVDLRLGQHGTQQ